jgi:hypothetical protein
MMSHVAKIEVEINDLDALKAACHSLGLEFVNDQKTFAWYGRHVGDYPVPEGFTLEEMGRCDHAIRVPNAQYEIGVVKRRGKYTLLWDFYHAGGLETVLGKGAGKLKQAYALERVKKEARLKNYRYLERKTEQGIRITLMV